MKRKWLGIICFLLIMCSGLANTSVIALAETTVITLETSENEVNNGEEIVVNVYLNSDASIGAYHTEVKYDAYRLEYVRGGDGVTDGKVILDGTGASLVLAAEKVVPLGAFKFSLVTIVLW